MAKRLDSFEFRSTTGSKKYPWDEWLNGDIWQLDEEDFGGTEAKYVAHQARNAAKRRKLKIRVSLNEKEQSVTLEVYGKIEDEENGDVSESQQETKEQNGEQEQNEEIQQPKKGRKGKKQ